LEKSSRKSAAMDVESPCAPNPPRSAEILAVTPLLSRSEANGERSICCVIAEASPNPLSGPPAKKLVPPPFAALTSMPGNCGAP
jgi:hypothetical protein